MQIGILEPKNFSPTAISMVSKFGNVITYEGRNLKKFLVSLDILFVRLSFQIDKSFLDNCLNLKYICSPTTGHNHLDKQYITKKNIRLITLRGEKDFLCTVKATPEHTFGLILATLRKYGNALADIREGVWDRDKCRGEELYDNKLGIIGLGRVGFQVAKYGEAFGANIIFYDKKNVKHKSGWTRSNSLLDLIKKSRIVVLCADYENNQIPIIQKEEIYNLKGKYFINTSRGELVDEKTLLQSAKNGNFKGVGLDVISNENSKNYFKTWQNLIKNHNVILTPHIGGVTKESLEKTEIFIATKLIAKLNKKG